MPKFRFRGKPGKPKQRRLLQGIHPIPTMVTLGNLLCGFGSIIWSMRATNPLFEPNNCFYWAGMLIFVAMIFDVMDGKVARWTKSASKFGMEMDSLCDVVSFGVAPGIMVKSMLDLTHTFPPILPDFDTYVLLMLAVYVCSAAIRLARYNVEAETGHRDFFFGMPSPGAAGCVASLAILISRNHHFVSTAFAHAAKDATPEWDLFSVMLLAMPFIMLILGLLMISRVHYPHVGDRLLRGRKSFMHIMVLILTLVLIVMSHEIMLALAFNGYMLLGLVNELRYNIFPSQRPAEWVSAGVDSVTAPDISSVDPLTTPTLPGNLPMVPAASELKPKDPPSA